MKYAFINAEGVVVNIISGALDESQLAQFLRDYAILFGAVNFVGVEDDAPVWIGGSYDSDSGIFTPPPIPEPEVIVAKTVAVIEEILPE
jgi:hypothetical protein